MNKRTLFGHPTGLYTLFFAEMWERFSYYGMRALLLFYMIKGFLGYGDSDAYAVYGAYTALVYMTPFFGGMLADRLLGTRRAVVFGGLLMAAGHLLMTVEREAAFFIALALLIAGNGFFKPNISTTVGALYPEGSPKRDGGFTIFYMGINLGAAMSPLLCGYVGEVYGWHWGFGLATIGMLTGLAVFVAPTFVTQLVIMSGAIAGAGGLLYFRPDNPFSIGVNAFVSVSLLASGIVSWIALSRGGIPKEVGAPPDPEKLSRPVAGILPADLAVYLGTLILVPVIALFVSGFSPLTSTKKAAVLIPEDFIKSLTASEVAQSLLQDLQSASEAADEVVAEELSERLDNLQQENSVTQEQYAAIREAVDLASGGDWEAAGTRTGQLIEQFPVEKLKAATAVFLVEMSKPAGMVLVICGVLATLYLLFETFRLDKVRRERMLVVLILTFFAMLFWSFFEQAGSSINNFTDRNVDRVREERTLSSGDVGTTITFRIPPGLKGEEESATGDASAADLLSLPLLSQEQLGHVNTNEEAMALLERAIRNQETRKEKLSDEQIDRLVERIRSNNPFTITSLTYLRSFAVREGANRQEQMYPWTVSESNIGMAVGGSEVPASVFQAANPIFIVLFGLVLTALWTFLGTLDLEPSTPVKFSLGLLQLGLGFGAFWYGAQTADDRGMVWVTWLLLGYLLHTTGELCLSPVGLSMVTRLSPARLVSTVMGAWFLATAFSQFLAAIIAQFTGVSHGGDGDATVIPSPQETVNVYGDVFGKIALAAIACGVICMVLSPILSKWTHSGVRVDQGKG